MISIFFETLGCRVNQIESESAARAFLDNGFSVETSSPSHNTILCIVNTCTVTSKAEQKARRIIRLLNEKCTKACILVTGCYAELDKSEIISLGQNILVLPGTQKDNLLFLAQKLPYLLQKHQNNPVNAVKDFLISHNCEKSGKTTFALSTDTFVAHSRSSVKIQDGCNNNCTFCRIHLARGKSISLDAKEVLNRVKKLEKIGQKEVVLTGINLSQYYGKFNETFLNLSSLLKFLLENTKEINFRLSSLYPQTITEEFCNIIKNERIRPHFHLSAQSGSDKILKLMARPYLSTDIIKAVENLRKVKNYAFIACDIIVGFAGETEEDFLQTLELCKKCNFSDIHVFPFSPRPGTEGAKMKPKIPQNITKERVKTLNFLANEQKNHFIDAMQGKIFKAIIEKRKSSIIRAVTENFLHVHITNLKNSEYYSGEVLVKITGKSKIANIDAQSLILFKVVL